MYTFWKRTSPPPSLSTFDAPDRETCQVRRARTNTPLQALVLMNDIQFVEAARKFAERVIKEGGNSKREKAQFAFRSVITRMASEEELKTLLEILDESLAEFESDPAAVTNLLKTGESPYDAKLDARNLAAWTMVAHVILNLSESVTRN